MPYTFESDYDRVLQCIYSLHSNNSSSLQIHTVSIPYIQNITTSKTERSIACKLKSISYIIISYSVLPHILYIFQPYPVSCWTGCWIREDWSERKICSVDSCNVRLYSFILLFLTISFFEFYKIYVHAISVLCLNVYL